MSDYLTRLEISNVGNVDQEIQTEYMKRVSIVEVVDENGNPWVPEPGPDPWDALVVQTDTYWSNLNDYSVGSEVFGHPAKFLGGSPDDTTYRYRWQYKSPQPNASWVNNSWTTYNNNVLEVGFTIPAEAEGGEVRLMSQARDTAVDPVDQVNSFATSEDVAWEPIVVDTRTTTTGLPWVGQLMTGTMASYSHGTPPINEEYQWQRSDTGDGGWTGITNWTSVGTTTATTLTYTTTDSDLNKYVRFASRATDANDDIAYGSGNSIGPCEAPPVMAPTVTKLNGEVVAQDEVHEVPAGTHSLQVVLNETPNDVQFFWSLRAGTGTLTPDPILVDHATYTIGPGDFAPLIAVTVESDISESTAASWSLISI